MDWSARPFVRIFFYYTAGVIATYFLPVVQTVPLLWIAFAILIIAFLYYFIVRHITSWKLKNIAGFLAGLLFLLSGILLTSNKMAQPRVSATDLPSAYRAEILKDPVITDQTVKSVLSVYKVSDTLMEENPKAKVMGFFRKDSLTLNLGVGDKLVFNGKLSEPEKPKNPYEFDYAEFLKINGIHYVTFIPSGNWTLLEHSSGLHPRYIATKLRNYLLDALTKNGLSGRNYAVTAAIILGYDQLMDPELEQDFVNAGAMHILCVSGLHVGIIYLVINFMLGFLYRKRSHRMFKMILLLIIVWFYALLTGLSPSVQRASVMISVFIIGSTMKQGRDTYNTLAASAVLMLFVDPLLIFNVGFQLSYAAVLGILVFHNPIYKLIFINNPVVDKLWSISVLSFAAQLGTFPIAAHYFHFFPTYFWLTNLVVFPLSFAIITTGFGFLFISWIPFISKVVGLMLSGMVFMLNSLVGLVEYLPFHGLYNLYFPWLKVVLVYIFVAFLFQLIIKRNIRFLSPVLLCVFMLVTFQSIRNYQLINQDKMVVYNIYGHSSLDFIKGKDHISLVDSILFVDNRKLDYHTKNSEVVWGLRQDLSKIGTAIIRPDINFRYDGEFGVFGDYKFLVLGEKNYYPVNSLGKIGLDAIFVHGKRKINFDNLGDCFTYSSLISDASVPYYKQGIIQKMADTSGRSYINTNKGGAYIIDF